MVKRILIPLCLLAIIVLDLVVLLPRYINFEALVGWDTPVYICLVRAIGERGVGVFVEENFYTHLYSFFGFFINELLVYDPFLTERILPITLNIVVVLFLTYVMQRVFRDYKLSILTALFTAISPSLIRMTADLRRNLMGCIFLLSTLLLIYEVRKKQSLKLYTALLISWALLIATHLETAFFLILVFIIYEVLVVKTWKLGFRKILFDYLWVYVPLILFFLLFYPYSLQFMRFFLEQVLYKQGLGPTTITISEILHYLLLLGGVNIPFVIIGLFESIKFAKKKVPYGFIVVFSISAFIVGITFSGFVERGLLFFPSGILGALGFLSVYRYLTRIEMGASKAIHYTIKNRKKLLVTMIFVILIPLDIYAADVSAIRWLHPYIQDKTYKDLRWLAIRVQEPVVIMFKRESPWAGGTLEMYRNWIEATLGSNYVYVGKLYSLLHGYRTDFNHRALEDFSLVTWSELIQDGVVGNLNNHPVVILDEFYSSSITQYERGLLDEVKPGIYVLKENYIELTSYLYSVRLIPYLDLYSSSNEWYIADKEWATTGYILETYNMNPDKIFYIMFRVLLLSNVNYSLKLRLLDVRSYNAPVEILFNNSFLFEVMYSGTEKAVEISVPLGEVSSGFHELTLRISDLTRPQMLVLDYIEFTAMTE